MMFGDIVGLAVGDMEGAIVGLAVLGDMEGAIVGLVVGTAVGEAVTSVSSVTGLQQKVSVSEFSSKKMAPPSQALTPLLQAQLGSFSQRVL